MITSLLEVSCQSLGEHETVGSLILFHIDSAVKTEIRVSLRSAQVVSLRQEHRGSTR